MKASIAILRRAYWANDMKNDMCMVAWLQFGTENSTLYTVNSSNTSPVPKTTVTDSQAVIYVPNYVTCGGLMDPYVRLVVDTQTTDSFKPAIPIFEGPSFDAFSYSGPQFGNCNGACSYPVTITGRNLGPEVRAGKPIINDIPYNQTVSVTNDLC